MQKNHVLHFNHYMDGLVQERRNFIANVLELHLSFTNPLIFAKQFWSNRIVYLYLSNIYMI